MQLLFISRGEFTNNDTESTKPIIISVEPTRVSLNSSSNPLHNDGSRHWKALSGNAHEFAPSTLTKDNFFRRFYYTAPSKANSILYRRLWKKMEPPFYFVVSPHVIAKRPAISCNFTTVRIRYWKDTLSRQRKTPYMHVICMCLRSVNWSWPPNRW